ncbi:hypothetical protein ACFFSW_11955 [Saccharothrix longispora]|uniref:Uncharacterized protein n=1 Tax=Saccharothrix longispora TaxID=33920 RepID=A0ABU1Q5I7_9PSEU|nr:hypothetical protein [Saccharothrix longispora]MDR6597951.1 hypothetical protein [Saccharothrix longispora]
MPTTTGGDPTGVTPVTAREDREPPGEARVCPILRTVADGHRRGRAEVGLALLARIATPARG